MPGGHTIKLQEPVGIWKTMMRRQCTTMHFKVLEECDDDEHDGFWSAPDRAQSALVQFDVSPPSADGRFRTVRVMMWQGVPYDAHPQTNVAGRYIGTHSVNVKRGQTVCFQKLVYKMEVTNSRCRDDGTIEEAEMQDEPVLWWAAMDLRGDLTLWPMFRHPIADLRFFENGDQYYDVPHAVEGIHPLGPDPPAAAPAAAPEAAAEAEAEAEADAARPDKRARN